MKYKPLTVIFFCLVNHLAAQDTPVSPGIDLMLLRGDYEKVIDTCRLIMTYDSLNPEIHYKMGIAFQNLADEGRAFDCYRRAAALRPDNKNYTFSLAKEYYGNGKIKMAEPLLANLCALDSMKWMYSYYLSSIYMQSGRFDDAIRIYQRFLTRDSANSVYLDKMAFANLKKGDYAYATDLYNKSLSINNKNLTAIKNLSFLYASAMDPDTAIQLLTRGIEIDSTDMDLYVGRAQLNFSKNYTKRALDDYMVILASGDSSKLYLKRIGIGYSFNFQPREAIDYLLMAYKVDSADYETCSYLGQCYYKIKDLKNSIYYYKKVLKILMPVQTQLGYTYDLCAESQKDNGDYKDAIANYLKAYAINADPNINMVLANLYDEKLNNKERAIFYYQRFLNTQKNSKMKFPPEYIEKVQKRLEFLKKPSPA